MNKRIKIIISLLFSFVFFISIMGCSLQDKIKEYSSDKEQCYLNTENITQFTYKNNTYTILEDIVSNGEIGEWIGYIRQIIALDQTGKILYKENIETDMFKTLEDLTDKVNEHAYIIPFLNIYTSSSTENYLIIDVNGQYHKAIINENVKESDKIFDFKNIEKSSNNKFKINPQNATQLIYDKIIYQVTSDIVSNDELGDYIDILAQNITFDKETKIPLSKKELGKIDFYGKNSEQKREQWFYKDIYEIYGTDKTEAVAVNINNQYYIAKRQ